jgi:hypothetical protein
MVISNNYYGINMVGSNSQRFVRNGRSGGLWSSRVRIEILGSNTWCGTFQTKGSGNAWGLAIANTENPGRKIGKRMWFSNKSYNFAVAGQTTLRQLGTGNKWRVVVQTITSQGISQTRLRDEKSEKMVEIPTLAGLEHIDHTCRNRVVSNNSLTF